MLAVQKNLPLGYAMLALMAGSAGIAIADVTIDACVTENSISHPSLAGDMQSLCGVSSSVGALIGFSISGFILHLIGPKVWVSPSSWATIVGSGFSFWFIILDMLGDRSNLLKLNRLLTRYKWLLL